MPDLYAVDGTGRYVPVMPPKLSTFTYVDRYGTTHQIRAGSHAEAVAGARHDEMARTGYLFYADMAAGTVEPTDG